MPSRRSHNKSRHGCTTCKRRRVKCDERRPICVNCSQRKETCTYSAPVPYVFARKASQTDSRAKSSSVDGSPDDIFSVAQHSTRDELGQSGSNSTTDPPELNMQQLELVLQWIQHTHRLLARNEETRQVWEVLVLTEGLTAPFLMHGILALSALHLSHLRRDTQQVTWFNVAIAHKNTALSMFSDQLHSISQSNAKAMMSFAALAVAFSFATALNSPTHEDGPSLSELTGVFHMSRGVQTIVNGAAGYLMHSSFAPLFNVTCQSPNTIPEHTLKALDLLENLVVQETQNSLEHIAGAYKRPITHMRDLVSFTFAEPTSMTLAAGWAIRAPAEFLDDLHTGQPLSLVVLAHYCAFLHVARENWCIGHWGRTVLEEILQILSPEWHVHVDWAIQEVFGEQKQS
ncbi:hypothetical protein N7492_000937 [Penicillium capsulatum]|uniref:Zn(2)-C6 fungal-type domain-containing protein n=1 Tax=Penicillium capsulatum TaxID=69766 RepID=A0A9W9ITR9_9EURO|nr:hypothetical protein N7492_000937 [Penicillium capsulatum]KAJ6130006.1 hypothetical protein N7512_002786 [Penicillium capsulatum]